MPHKKIHFQIFPVVFTLLLVVFSYCFALSVRAARVSPMQKLDPILKPLILNQEPMAAPGGMLSIAHRREPGLINSIIKVSGTPMAIESTGARVRSIIGDIVTADVPRHALDDLISMSNVIYVQAARRMQPALLDVSVLDTGADQVWRSATGYTGKGVIVGVIDGGIDWRHPDFRNDDGTSRILYIWDQAARTQSQYPEAYGYGVEWTKAHIDSGQCQEMDPTSHGTHIASTMAGNGRDRHGFTGMAPEADIIAVKTSFEDADILDAADYIFRKARELNRPAVINMSFGSHWGPHDGTELLDQAIDELLGEPGRAVVASAGNDGGDAVHLGTSGLRHPAGENYPWAAIEPLVGAQSIVVQIWHAPGSDFSVRLLLPENEKGDLGDSGIGWAPRGRYQPFIVPDGPLAGARIVIDRYPASRFLYPNFDNTYLHISNNGDPTIPIDEYIYAIEFDGSGVELDAYVMWRARFTTRLPGSISCPSSSFLMAADGNKTIISPASADSVICVGSYVSKSEWIDSDNRIRTESLGMNNISVFSSRGPLLDGGWKPDIAAPGEMIVAAFSSDSWDRPRSVYRDGQHVSWRGTSMSSPHVAGAIALMFQQDPRLTTSEVKHRLNSSAVDRGPAGWDKAWGYGKLDVLAAMGIPSAPSGVRATADDGSITLNWYRNSESDIAGYSIYARSENREWTIDAGNATSCELTDLSNGVLVSVSVSAYNTDGNEGPKTPEITVVPNPTAADVTPPEPPGDLSVVSVNGALDLTWSRNSEYDLSSYKIYYGTSTGNYDKTAWPGKSTDYRIKNLTNDVRVYIAVSSRDTSGNESAKSKEVSSVPRLFYRSTVRYQSGWPVSMKHDVYSSPALYDVDGDGRLEVAISGRDGEVRLLRWDGRDMAGWPVSTDSASVSSPALGDVDNDGSVEVAVGAGDMAWLWHENGIPMQGWPVETRGSITASPALGDVDGDGMMEVVIGSRDGMVYAYNCDGSLADGWPVTTGYIHSSAALGDIDGDGNLEVVVGSESGDLYVFNGDGTMADGWPVYVGTAVSSSPALGDIDGDGGVEIVAADERGKVYAWRSDGELVDGWPVDLREGIVASPALGDVDGDRNSLEIVISTRYGTVYVLKSDGTTMDGWPVSVMDIVTSSPALGDINGDGNVEIVVATGTGQHYIGLVYAFRDTGRILGTVWPMYTEGNICDSSPALGDLDGDGDVELIVGSCRLSDGSGGKIHAWDLTGRVTEESIVWSGFRHDSHHTGFADDTLPPSFVVAALQNAALKRYVDVYVVASERLIAPPELTVGIVPNDGEERVPAQSTPLVEIDADSHIYQAHLALESDGQYVLTVSGTDVNGNMGSSTRNVSIQVTQEKLMAPAGFSLLSNYPNPFNPGTWIPYELSQPANVTVSIYSVAGRLIRSLNLGRRAAGSYTSMDDAAYWDGKDDAAQEAASGLYFCVLEAGGSRAVRKMILLK